MTKNSIRADLAGWRQGQFAQKSAPYFVRFLSGSQRGRTLRVVSNSRRWLVLDITDQSDQQTPLRGVTNFQVRTDDRFELVPADTLNTVFGANTLARPLLVKGALIEAKADMILIPGEGSETLRFWFKRSTSSLGGKWRLSGKTGSYGKFVIDPGTPLRILRRAGRSAAELSLLGRVPTVDPLLKTPGGGFSGFRFVSLGLPVKTTLDELLDPRLDLNGTSEENADRFFEASGSKGAMRSFWMNAKTGDWFSENDGAADDRVLKPLKTYGIVRQNNVSGRNSFVRIQLPYQLD